ncbi:hypothetical protein Airi01_026600 [Actinoallomurus iriomotensis]|uniref:Uncharacterized protein n=1 Tax=Actinoallomurus iriomotensis TaxID=478107 RepID=A0A9W6VJS4_9ACTN|nr:hypothetical protein Airi01_026600 [Actinoallomurus iriomotensis]
MSRGGLAGRASAGILARRYKRSGAAPVNDGECFEQARHIQATYRDWLVMWSPWHRTFTAFSCFTPEPLVVDEPTPEALISAMVRVELHHSPTRVDALSSFPSASAGKK